MTIKDQINRLTDEVEREFDRCSDGDHEYVCRLLNVKELLRRAWHQADGSPCVDNDLV